MKYLSIIIFAIAMFSGGAMIGAKLEQGRQRDLDDEKHKERCKDCSRYHDILDEV